jgi:DNA replication and repair protein RecF
VAGKSSFDEETLGVYDDQMIPFSERIFGKRNDFVNRLVPVFRNYYNFISSRGETVDLSYHSQLADNSYSSLLANARTKDRFLQYTTVGIHKDDLNLSLHGLPIKRIGSQGQQKTYLVALKLAQFDFIKEVNGILPMFLFDDIFDKFDEQRVKQIIKLVAEEHFGQIFITHTDPGRMKNILHDIGVEYRFFHIETGEVIHMERNGLKN